MLQYPQVFHFHHNKRLKGQGFCLVHHSKWWLDRYVQRQLKSLLYLNQSLPQDDVDVVLPFVPALQFGVMPYLFLSLIINSLRARYATE